MRRKNNDAMSELLGLIYIMMISTTMISAIFLWAPQYLEGRKVEIRGEASLNQFENIEEVLHQVINQGVGGSKSVNFVTDKGYIRIESVGLRFVFFYPRVRDFDFGVSGFDIDDPEKSFNYYQIELPGYWDDLDSSKKKVNFDIHYLNSDTAEPRITRNISYPSNAPSTISFLNSSGSRGGDPINSWEWDFGDGSPTSNFQNPVHEFTQNNVYTVGLRVTDDQGTSDIRTHDIVVGNPADPHAAFSWTPVNPTTADEITFISESTDGSVTQISTIDWDFGYLGGTSPEQNPTYQYSINGQFTVTLKLNGGGGTLEQAHTIFIGTGKPTADFTTTGDVTMAPDLDDVPPFKVNEDITFKSTSTDPDAGALPIDDFKWCFNYDDETDDITDPTWVWNLEGTATTDGFDEVTHPYSDIGTYTVILQVTDEDGETGTVRHDIVVVADSEDVLDYDIEVDGTDAVPLNGDLAVSWGVFHDDDENFLFEDIDPPDGLYDEATDLIIIGSASIDGTKVYHNDAEIAIGTDNKPYIFDDIVTVNDQWDSGEDVLFQLHSAGATPGDPADSDVNEIAQAGTTSEYYIFEDKNGFKDNEYYLNDDYHAAFTCPFEAFTGVGAPFKSESVYPDDPPQYSWKYQKIGEDEIKNAGTQSNVNIIFPSAGTYSVSLSFYIGEIQHKISHNIEVINTKPISDFSFAPSCNPLIEVPSGNSLSDAVKIDVLIDDGTEDHLPVVAGRIWVFDFGSITYETSSNDIARELIFQNGVIIASNKRDSYLISDPRIHESVRQIYDTGLIRKVNFNEFIMRIIQFKPENEKTIGPGKATYKFTMKLTDNYIREPGDSHLGFFKTQIFGDQAEAWVNSFKSLYGFQDYDYPKGTYIYGQESGYTYYKQYRIIFIHSIFDIDVEVI